MAEQDLQPADTVLKYPHISRLGEKKHVVAQIIRIVEFFLEVTGKRLEHYQLIVLSGDLYDKFRNDSLEDIMLMLKMARQGDFGKVYNLDTFTIMDWIPQYFLHKSEEREKLIEQQKRKRRKEPEPPSTEAAAKFEELYSRLSTSQLKKAETFSISGALKSMDCYLETLPETSMKLSDSDLKYELRRCEHSNREAYEILSLELERRRQSKLLKGDKIGNEQ